MSKRVIVFDFGGVLMRTTDYQPRRRWDERLGLPYGTVERTVHGSAVWQQAQLGQISPTDYWQAVGDRLALRPNDLTTFATDYYSGDTLDQALIAHVRQLRADGVTVALLSNDSAELRPRLATLGIATLFDPLLISAEIGVAKPSAECFHKLLAALQRPAEQVLFIDDNAENIVSAASLGILTLHYTLGTDVPAYIKAALTL
jgi:HAD superfamily hydrolase (TIGR01509 family)